MHEVLRDYLMGHQRGGAQAVYSRQTDEMWDRLLHGMQAWWEAYEAAVAFSQISPQDLTNALGGVASDVVLPAEEQDLFS